jgi:hypothetical protein
MISAARFPYLSILAAAARARSRLGGSCASHSMQLLTLVMAAATGCLISCASDAAISPNVLTRLMCASSASSCRNLSRSCSARLRSVMSWTVPNVRVGRPEGSLFTSPWLWTMRTSPVGRNTTKANPSDRARTNRVGSLASVAACRLHGSCLLIAPSDCEPSREMLLRRATGCYRAWIRRRHAKHFRAPFGDLRLR